MARLPNLAFARNFSKFSCSFVRPLMTTQSRCEKALDELSKNAYYEKYADKIAKLQKTSPEEFLSRIDGLKKTKAPKKNPETITEGKFSQLLNPKKPLSSVEASEASLDKVMKLDLIKDKTPEEIKEIWHQYHIQKNYISAVVPADDYAELEARGRQYPTFLFPLPRKEGYEFIMAQFEGNCVHFTPLLYYQVHKENAPECLTMTHYTELKDEKKIVLMRGEYDKNVIDLKEAQCLANQLQLYYVRPTGAHLELLERFTKRPDEFKHMDLIKQIENLSL
ncbi:ATP synthase mitochondrial F1 complex assembly factor 1 [Tribolium madens]|uniref:ATP synthase mitochondrial F1 complex assembly factor 1 n=1 Tax=Tribolium madens TaxID=41895 RepID=UPI001CF759A3|nr:ATP synthase mitochondrial F1 complex assembly factor 1 [Tribolium madens]